MSGKYNLFAALLLLLPVWAFPQKTLTLREAAQSVLENNYGVKVAQNNQRVAENNISRLNNGYLPTVNLSAGPTATFGGSTQNFTGALGEVKVENAFSWGANASLSANYNLFDKRRDYTVDQLKEALALTDLQLRQTMEGNLAQLFNGYYEVARLTENLRVATQALDVSRRRLQRAEYRAEYGRGIRLDVLNAQVDIQRDSVNLLNIQRQLAISKRNLNVIMGAQVENDFAVDTSFGRSPTLSNQALLEAAKTNNVGLLILDKNKTINEMNLQINDAGRKPTVGANGAYNFAYSDNAAGSFIESSSSRGLNAGVTANWNIFDGGRRNIQEQNTRIALESLLLQKEQLKLELERDIRNAWETFQNALFVLKVEENALATNQQNLERTEELFNAGQLTSVEFRQAQLNLLNAATSRNNAKYAAKVAELQLLWLSGGILDALK